MEWWSPYLLQVANVLVLSIRFIAFANGFTSILSAEALQVRIVRALATTENKVPPRLLGHAMESNAWPMI